MKSKYLLLGTTLSMALALPNLASAAKIIPHFTEGPGEIFGFIPTLPMTGPTPILPGSDLGIGVDTGTDCSAISDYDKLSTQTGAVCTAVEKWERIIKDDITINFEIYAIGMVDNVLGFSSPRVVTIASPELDGAGYMAMRKLLKQDERREADSLSAPRHLPKFKKLKLLLPGDGAIPQDWKPQTIEVASAAAKALGLNVDELTEQRSPDLDGLTSLPNTDAVFTSSLLIENPDYDQTDGIGVGPVILSEWDALDVLNNVIPFAVYPEIFDYTGIVTHELGHSLGYFSSVEFVSSGGVLALPESSQAINATDLYRFAETDLKKIKNYGKYRKLPRQLAVREGTQPNEPGALPIQPELGNHVTVFHVDRHNKSLLVIPMAGGDLEVPDRGDSTQASHSRSSFVRVRGENGDLLSQNWIENRCDDSDQFCSARVGDPDHSPSTRLMDPIASVHTLDEISIADAVIMDLIGYDIDYGKLSETSRSGVVRVISKGKHQVKVSTKELLKQLDRPGGKNKTYRLGDAQVGQPQVKVTADELEQEFGVKIDMTRELIVDRK